MSVCRACMESTSGTCPRHPTIAWTTFKDADPGFVDQLVKAERSRTFEQTRERCAKVLDEMAKNWRKAAIIFDPSLIPSECIVAAETCEAGSARIRALPEKEGK